MTSALFAAWRYRSVTALMLRAAVAASLLPQTAAAAEGVEGTPRVVGHRTIHVFRAPLGAFTAAERAEEARRKIEQAFEQPGEGWTSVKSTEQGIEIELDGKPLFFVLPGDARTEMGETALSDFYVAYKLVVHVATEAPATRAQVASDLHAAIQDEFNRQGVQIMSPHYVGDPEEAKVVPESEWHMESEGRRP